MWQARARGTRRLTSTCSHTHLAAGSPKLAAARHQSRRARTYAHSSRAAEAAARGAHRSSSLEAAARHPRAALAAAALLAAAWLSLLYASVCERAIWHTHHSAHKVDTGICGGALRG